jgi:hypothetical protein
MKHGTGFPANTLAEEFGNHLLNIKLTSDTDNGQFIAANPDKWLSWDVFEEMAATVFEGRIVDKTPNGNYLVLVTKTDGNTCMCYQKPLTAYESPREFTREEAFYNREGDIVRAYVLSLWDRVEISEENFEGEPEVGAKITGIQNKKLVVASGEGEGEGGDQEPTVEYEAVTTPTGNPSTSGYFELVDGAYVASTDTEVDPTKTYYVVKA